MRSVGGMEENNGVEVSEEMMRKKRGQRTNRLRRRSSRIKRGWWEVTHSMREE